MSPKRKAAWGVLSLVGALAAGLIAYSAFGGTFDYSISCEEAQQKIDSKLPRTTKGITVQSAQVTCTQENKLKVTFHATGEKEIGLLRALGLKKQKYYLIASVTGTPRYVHDKNAFFMEPEQNGVEIVEFGHLTDNTGAFNRFLDKAIKNERWRANVDEYVREWGPDFREWLRDRAQNAAMAVLERFPVYTLKDDSKGWAAYTFLDKIEVKDGKIFVKFTLWRLTVWVFLGFVFLCAAIALMIALARNPQAFEAIAEVAAASVLLPGIDS